jgi:hypothetical protein
VSPANLLKALYASAAGARWAEVADVGGFSTPASARVVVRDAWSRPNTYGLPVEHVRLRRAQAAYDLRARGKTLTTIAEHLGYVDTGSPHDAARRHAAACGLPFKTKRGAK